MILITPKEAYAELGSGDMTVASGAIDGVPTIRLTKSSDKGVETPEDSAIYMIFHNEESINVLIEQLEDCKTLLK